jgi:hypothetical protein
VDGQGANEGTHREGWIEGLAASGGLSPWETRIDLAGLPPGRYTFAVGSFEGSADGEYTADTRTITVR